MKNVALEEALSVLDTFWARFSAGLKLHISHQLACSYVKLFFLEKSNILEVILS